MTHFQKNPHLLHNFQIEYLNETETKVVLLR